MGNKWVLSALLALASTGAYALEPKQLDVAVKAVVSEPDFELTPVDGWTDVPVRMTYSQDSQSFPPVTLKAYLKSSAGAITAKYVGGNPQFVNEQGNPVDLLYKMSINRAQLPGNGSPVQILNDADAASGKEVDFRFSPVKVNDFIARPGTYTAHVGLLFETQAP